MSRKETGAHELTESNSGSRIRSAVAFPFGFANRVFPILPASGDL